MLPLVVVFLNSDYLNSKIYDKLELLSKSVAWFPSKGSERNEVAVFFPIGSGLEGTQPALQTYFSQALSHRLKEQDLQNLIDSHGLTAEISNNSTYTRLLVSSDKEISLWLDPLMYALQRQPKLDWNQLNVNVTAELHVLSAQDRWKLLSEAAGVTEFSLTPALYDQAWSQLARIVIRSPKKPDTASLTKGTASDQHGTTLYPLEIQLSTRKGAGADLLLWQLPQPKNLDQYLVEQIIGELISSRLSTPSATRWLLRIDTQSSLAILETGLGQGNKTWRQLISAPPERDEIKQAGEAFVKRWDSFTESNPLDWPGILMLNGYSFDDTQERVSAILDQGSEPFIQVWQTLEQPPLRTIQQIPLSENR